MGAGLKPTHSSIYSRSSTGINALCKGNKLLVNIPVVLDQLFQFLGLTFMSRNKQSRKYLISSSYSNEEFDRWNKYTCIVNSTANYMWGQKLKDFYTAKNAQVSSKSVALLSSSQYTKMLLHCLLRLDDTYFSNLQQVCKYQV